MIRVDYSSKSCRINVDGVFYRTFSQNRHGVYVKWFTGPIFSGKLLIRYSSYHMKCVHVIFVAFIFWRIQCYLFVAEKQWKINDFAITWNGTRHCIWHELSFWTKFYSQGKFTVCRGSFDIANSGSRKSIQKLYRRIPSIPQSAQPISCIFVACLGLSYCTLSSFKTSMSSFKIQQYQLTVPMFLERVAGFSRKEHTSG